MLMARLYSGNLGMVALRNAYHGGSAGTIGLTALNSWKYSIPQVCTSSKASDDILSLRKAFGGSELCYNLFLGLDFIFDVHV